MKYSLLALLSIGLLGCSTHDVSDVVDNALVVTSGNKPPKFFAFASLYRANGYIMQHKDFSFMMPETKEKDWRKMSGWSGAYIYGGIGIGVDNPDVKTIGSILGYGFNFSSSVSKYTEMQRALEEGNIQYIRSKIRIDKEDKLRIEHHGKENNICRVMEYSKPKQWQKIISYRCYKFNPKKTMYKSVTTKLIYTKSPNLPTKYKSLAKEYTYQDLQKRAKRTLDSLYIKDGWSK